MCPYCKFASCWVVCSDNFVLSLNALRLRIEVRDTLTGYETIGIEFGCVNDI